MPGGQKTMEGRIEIAPIENPRHRRITYAKRKAGLVRKATELAVLCDADVAVLMCNADKSDFDTPQCPEGYDADGATWVPSFDEC